METYSPQGNICGPIMPRFVLSLGISMGAKLVYSLLCDHARDKDHCWPSHDSISKALAASVSSVKNWLNELQANKLIVIERRSYHSSRYYLLRPANLGNSAPVNALRPDRPKYGRFGQNLATEKNVKNNKINTPPLPPARPARAASSHEHRKRGGGDFLSANSVFENFWSAYPKQEAKELARSAWHRLWRQGQLPGLAVLLAALEKFKVSASWNREHGRFIPQLCNWLKGQRWLDEISDAGASGALTPNEKAKEEQARQALANLDQQEQARQAKYEAETAHLRPEFEKFLSHFSDASKMRGPAWGLWCALHRKGNAPKIADVPSGSGLGVYEFLKNWEIGGCYA
ncbi:MAG: helix-turn-helix domain-containing protein [Desulfovibrio sp.]|nr:helix-turn-helix domain-containing protein [Desulfovibrio sp.]